MLKECSSFLKILFISICSLLIFFSYIPWSFYILHRICNLNFKLICALLPQAPSMQYVFLAIITLAAANDGHSVTSWFYLLKYSMCFDLLCTKGVCCITCVEFSNANFICCSTIINFIMLHVFFSIEEMELTIVQRPF
jgi:hypothetical protein